MSRISRRLTPTWPTRRSACAGVSCGYWGHREWAAAGNARSLRGRSPPHLKPPELHKIKLEQRSGRNRTSTQIVLSAGTGEAPGQRKFPERLSAIPARLQSTSSKSCPRGHHQVLSQMNYGAIMSKQLYSSARPLLTGEKWWAPFAIIASSLLLLPAGLASAQSTEPSVVHQFGRPVRAGEHTYDWYRRTHADAAAARYGVKASDVGDGMDTWHWWVGVDNPGFWRENTKATSTALGSLLGVKVDFLRLLNSVPRNKRFELMGLINDPDTVAADTPRPYGLILDRLKEGTLAWAADTFGYSSGIIG